MLTPFIPSLLGKAPEEELALAPPAQQRLSLIEKTQERTLLLLEKRDALDRDRPNQIP